MHAETAFVEARPAAIAAVLSQWRLECSDFGVLALLPESEQAAVPDLQALFRDQGLALLGAVFPALVTEQGFAVTGAWLIRLSPMPAWFLIDRLAEAGEAAPERIAAAVREAPLPPPVPGQAAPPDGAVPTLFLIFDGTVPNIGALLDGVYHDLRHAVRYAGINAGSETFQPMPCLFDRDMLVRDGVAALLLPDARVVVQHGYPVARTRMQAVSTTGNRISRIDGRPAFEVYQEVIKADFGVDLTHGNFYDYAVHYPFGLIMAAEVVVRIPVGFDADGTVICAGEVPPNSILRLIEAPALTDSRCVEQVARRIGTAPQSPDEALLVFYCAGRRMHLGEAAAEELRQLHLATGALHLAGALSLGEIDTIKEFGTPVFHNAALVCL